MNLIYICVFHQESYINLLNLLVTSISVNANINKDTTDILIITSSSFQPLIQKELDEFNLPLDYYILDLHTLFEASCCKLRIFQYSKINKYQKILYLDTDVLINSDINVLFHNEISSEKIYLLEEGNIGHTFWGSDFFDFTKYDKNTNAFSAGVMYFMNSLSMKTLFENTNNQIENHIRENKPIPGCLDQPFLVYNSFIEDKYDNQYMKKYLENNPSDVSLEKIIYHFPGGPGDYLSKWHKMNIFFEKIKVKNDEISMMEENKEKNLSDTNTVSENIRIFESRNEMIKYYCNTLSNPKLLEIGVFKGDFLEYLVKECNIGSIDAVDLFEGITCSGNVDGNDVIYCDIGQSYLELLEKYRENPNIKIHKSRSTDFLVDQEDNSYDIIYIDGDHSYDGVKEDLLCSFRKIKNGGYIMGHDYEINMKKAKNIYDWSGLKQAVDEFCTIYEQNIQAKGMDGCVSYCIHIKK